MRLVRVGWAVVLGAAALVLSGAPAMAAPTEPDGMILQAVSCPSAKFCAAVGLHDRSNADGPDDTSALSQMWNGTRWHTVHLPDGPITESVMTGVSCTSARFCMAVGFGHGGHTFSAKWNGTKWSYVRSKHPSSARHQGLTTIDCPAANKCFSVGDVHHKGASHAITQRWNGKSWRSMTPPRAGHHAVTAAGISCATTSSCVLVGHYVKAVGHGKHQQRAYLATWHAGSHSQWKRADIPDPAAGKKKAGTSLADVSCVSARHCLAVGSFNKTPGHSSELIEQWNGRRWTRDRAPIDVSKISCTAAKHCVGMGDFSNTSYVLSGSTWHSEPFAHGADQLRGLDCASARTCYAVGSKKDSGSDHTLVQFRGSHWRTEPTPP